ncbi:thermonuclease family protein [Mesorhizobium sp. WSM3860]|uniref:thermonuclease family protein n=1 Tax=Mesorhizobium sp. WSM3860 TaxID=2029403 RepID=UPI000BAEAD01|nr:thermonuclease family protein [Mesorhizobium sp. WSM3860]PBC02700.1 succinoglycan biosynthesis protein exoi [Mesorhizobium sp. WSM3860]
MSGIDKSRYDNRSDQWRRRTGAKSLRTRRWASVPLRLVLVTVAAVSALVAQFVMHNSASLPEIDLQNIIKPRPVVITGLASVIDGDTIEIHGQRVRFNGIDAPESRQYCDDTKGFEYPCGRRSAEALDKFLAASRPLQCSFVTWDRYGRFVGSCTRADGTDVAAWMVEHGQALDWPKYSSGAYAAQQAKAQAAKLGLWVGNFQAPWDWRTQRSDDVRAPVAPTFALGSGNAGCSVKGNISADGERIYHLPGQKYYSVTIINPAKGERWFCSEAEAVAAGWRRSKR